MHSSIVDLYVSRVVDVGVKLLLGQSSDIG